MKKNISVEQLQELEFNKQKKIATMVGEYEKCVKKNEDEKEDINLSILSKSINIGNMIEILLDNIPETNYIEDSLDIECDRATKTSLVEFRNNKSEYVEFEGKELCDALWKSVKSIL